MGLNRVRVDSVAKLQKKKTMAELQEENEALKTKVSSLETNLDNTQMALCDVYEQLIAVTSADQVPALIRKQVEEILKDLEVEVE